jgi:hypothetical protein
MFRRGKGEFSMKGVTVQIEEAFGPTGVQVGHASRTVDHETHRAGGLPDPGRGLGRDPSGRLLPAEDLVPPFAETAVDEFFVHRAGLCLFSGL